jgi:HK97 family phage portal protein
MSWWDRLLGREVKYSAVGPIIATSLVGQPAWTPRDYKQLAEEAYRRNAIAYRCVKMIASAAAAMPWVAYSGIRERSENDPILKLLANPNPNCGGQQLFEAYFAYMLLSGNGYIEGVGPNDAAPPSELWVHRPDRMQVIPGRFGLPEGFRYQVNGLIKDWQADPVTGQGPILHVKEFNPLDDWYGMPRVDPAAYAIDRHNAGSAHNKALLDNGGRPSGVLSFKSVTINGTSTNAPQKIIDTAKERLLESSRDLTKRGEPLVLGGDVEWHDMGITPKDMDFGESMDAAGRDICSAFGVPHILVIPGQATYNNLREARLQLYEDTVLPLAGQLRGGLNTWLAPRFGSRLRLEHDLDEVPALEPRREAKRKSTIELFKAKLITRNEARDALQYDEIEGAEGAAFDASTAPSTETNKPDVTNPDTTAGDA